MSDSSTPETTDNSFEEIFLSSVSVVSTIACIFTIIISSKTYNSNSTYNKFVIFLAISDLLFAFCKNYSAFLLRIFYIPEGPNAFCDFQGSIQQYSLNASTFIEFSLSLYFYWSANKEKGHIMRYINICIAASMIIPALVSAWFLFSNEIGKADLWCFPDINENYWQVTILVHGLYLVTMMATYIIYFMFIFIMFARDNFIDIVLAWSPVSQFWYLPIIVLSQFNYHFPGVIGHGFLEKLLLYAGAVACLRGFSNGFAYVRNKDSLKNIIEDISRDSEGTELKQPLVI